MHIALIVFLFGSATWSFISLIYNMADEETSPGVKFVVSFFRLCWLVWALLMAILLCSQ